MQTFFIKTKIGRTEITTPSKWLVEQNKPAIPSVKSDGQDQSLGPTYFEPKTKNRFVVYLTDADGKIIIPSYLIRKIDRPTFYYNWFGIKKSNPLFMEIYDPIAPSGMECIQTAVNNNIRYWNIFIKMLGPVGDSVEEWQINNAKLLSISTPTLDWSDTGNPLTILLKFNIKHFRGI